MSGSLQPESEADCAGLSDYLHARSGLISHHEYLIPALLRELGTLDHAPDRARVFDLGCGNGVVASILASRGYAVTGVDPSSSGIRLCRSRFPGLDLHRGSAYDDLRSKYGQFPIVTSLEVVEHVFAPRKYAATLYELLEPEGTAIVSTPFHGYWKNVALAVSGRMDDHYLPLWDGGHIKFWSEKTLRTLMKEAGFTRVRFTFAGRWPPFWKSMLAVVKK